MTKAKRQRKRSDGPAADEFEVSILGPGKGEAVVVHLGGGDWITVDSCIHQRVQRNAVLDYLTEVQVDVSKQLHLVVGTHAHDDHIAGIADIYEAAPASVFVCSSAMASEEFFHVLRLDRSVAGGVRPSIRSQYERVFAEAARRGRQGETPPLRRAIEGRVIWSRPPSEGLPGARVQCLSPSDEAVTRATADLARGALTEPGDRKRFSNRDPNEFAVALRVEFGSQSAILGADLPVGPAGCGWAAVLSNVEVHSRASLFKVPHHGSVTGHHEAVWDDLLTIEPVALLAPFRGGRKSLPSLEDVVRIRERTGRAYIAASPRPVPKRPATRNMSMTLAGVASDVRDPWGTVGQVRARLKPDEPAWDVELFEPARELSTIY